MRRLALLVASASFLVPAMAHADVYRCSESGRTVYSDRPCATGSPGAVIMQTTPTTPPKPKPRSCTAAPFDDAHARAMKEIATSAMVAQLKDPHSAQISAPSYAKLDCPPDGTREIVCARINAKNSYGGYTGEREWIYAHSAKSSTTIWDGERHLTLAEIQEAADDSLACLDASLKASLKAAVDAIKAAPPVK